MSEGYKCIIHLHTTVDEVEVTGVDAIKDQEKGQMVKNNFLKTNSEGIIKISCKNLVCVEKIEVLAAMSKFTLRDEGKTIAFGEIIKIKPIVKKEVPLI